MIILYFYYEIVFALSSYDTIFKTTCQNDDIVYYDRNKSELPLSDIYRRKVIMGKKKHPYLKANHKKVKKPPISWRIAGREEGIRRLLDHKSYYEHFSQNDLNFRLQKKDASLREWTSFACDQVSAFSKEEGRIVNWAMRLILRICKICLYRLPETKPIVFIKTSMEEECLAAAYTHGTEIYLGQELLNTGLTPEDDCKEHFLWTVAHELFHCFTRQNPDFRRDMYKIIHFSIMDHEISFSREVLDRIIRNPDVERHDSYAEFILRGKPVKCAPVFTTEKPFEKPGDNFMTSMKAGLVPVENPSRIYALEESSNYKEIFGENTEYYVDPEEVLADNFAYALILGPEGYEYQTPEIIESILSYLSDGK